MKKIKLSKIEDVYLLLNEEEREILQIKDRTISGKDIYEKLYLPQLENGFYEIKLITDLEAKEDLVIYNHLKTLFKKIDASVQAIFISETKNIEEKVSTIS